MDSLILKILCLSIFFTSVIRAAAPEPPLPKFGDVVQVMGNMERTDQDFEDGLALDFFSPANRSLIVKQNLTPLSAKFISGTSGESFVALSNYSYIIKFNETANDLIAKIEIPYEPEKLEKMGIQEANTYVGTLAPDGKSWIVDETQRNIHRSENNTRIIKMTSLDGEYMLLGRNTTDTGQIFVQYGQGETRTVNITGSSTGAIQEAEFVDGLRFSISAPNDTRLNVDLKPDIERSTLPPGMASLNTFSWVVNSSAPASVLNFQMKVPINNQMIPNNISASSLTVAKRPLNANSSVVFQLLSSQEVFGNPENRIRVQNITSLDGEYIIAMGIPMNRTARRYIARRYIADRYIAGKQ